jgi:hypothetical protein
MRISFIAATAVAGLSLGGCAYGGLYDGYGSGVSLGVGYGNYGYGNYGYPYSYGYGYPSSYGYPYGYGYSRWSDPFYGGYGSPYWGWNDGFYYPGTGIYVYDRFRRPFVWTDRQRAYWIVQRQRALSSRPKMTVRENWSGFNPRRTTPVSAVVTTRPTARAVVVERARSRSTMRPSRVTVTKRRSPRDSDDD